MENCNRGHLKSNESNYSFIYYSLLDSLDPVQLNLLFVQARDSILNGTHPVTLDKACELAGIQCQAQFGDYVEAKHKPGFLEFVHKFAQRPFSSTFFSIEISLLVFSLKEFLPQSYMEVKGVEKKIFGEHKKNNGLTESEAKVGYVKTARSLSTYGVTFFLVKVVSLNTSQLNQSNTSQLTFVNAFSIILCFDSRPGKKEGQKRTGPAPAGLYERFCPAPRRTNQRDSKSLAVDDDSSLGRVAKNFHPRLW